MSKEYTNFESAVSDGFLVMPKLADDDEDVILFNKEDMTVLGFARPNVFEKRKDLLERGFMGGFGLIDDFISDPLISSYFSRIVNKFFEVRDTIKTREHLTNIIPSIICDEFDKFEISILATRLTLHINNYNYYAHIENPNSTKESLQKWLTFNLLFIFSDVYERLINLKKYEDAKYVFENSKEVMKEVFNRCRINEKNLKEVAEFYEKHLEITKMQKTLAKNTYFKPLLKYFKKETLLSLLKTGRAYPNYVLPKVKFTEAELIDLIKNAPDFKSNGKIMGAQTKKENACGYVLKTQTVTKEVLKAILEGPYANDKESFLSYMTRRKKTMKNIESLDDYIFDIVNAGCNLKYIDKEKQLQEDSSKLIIEVGGAD